MRRFVVSALAVASRFPVTLSAQPQGSPPGTAIRFRALPAAIPDGFRIPGSEARWVGMSGDFLTYQLPSGRSSKLPVADFEIQWQSGNRAKPFSLVGGLIGTGAGALVALSKYDEQWRPGREAGCAGPMSFSEGCWGARPPEVTNSKKNEVLGGALIGGLAGALIGRFIGSRTPAWVTVDPLGAGVQLRVQSR